MAVRVGSARINEKGGINGGQAGDQTGGEVSTQNWYLHAKGWVVIRAKDQAVAEKIAKCMQMACDNNNIGYCQNHRDSLKSAAGRYGYDVSKVKSKVEVDCSALVRVCCLYAGIDPGNIRTISQVDMMRKTGKFDILTEDKYCKSSDYLKRGDILCTKTSGHTVVVLNDGAKVGTKPFPAPKPNKIAVDGDWGVSTTKATQRMLGTTVDGIVSRQPRSNKKYLPNAYTGSWEFKVIYKGGSDMIRALKKLIGAKVDGYFGKGSVIAMQNFLANKGFYKGRVDGSMGPATVKAWQQYINSRL